MRRVFISYSHDSDEHRRQVQALAERLRRQPGISVVIDSDTGPGGPAEGWPQWSERQVIEADRVLVACTAAYGERYEGNQAPGEGRGAVCEARAIRQFLYDCSGVNHKVRVVLFDAANQEYIPTQLKPYHAFLASRDDTALVDWLLGKASVPQELQPADVGLSWPLSDAAYAWPLADRREPFAMFEEALTGRSGQRVLLFHGPSGTGKTALREALLAYAKHLSVAAAAFDLKGCPSLDELYESLKLDLGPAILAQACRASGAARFYALIADLQQIRAPLVLFLDTWEQASQEAQDWVEKQLLPRIDRAPGVVVVVAGQRVPEHAGRTWAGAVATCALQPIPRVEDWLAFARDRLRCTSIQRHDIETLTRLTDGDPGKMGPFLSILAEKASVLPAAQGGA